MFQTIPSCFDATVARHGTKPALVRKVAGVWEPLSYAEFARQAQCVTAALIHMGIASKDRVAILAENRPEWVISDQGILAAGIIDVPIYPTLSAPQVQYVLDNCGAKAIILSHSGQLAKVLSVVGELPELRHIVVMDDLGEGTEVPGSGRQPPEVLSWPEFLERGAGCLESTASERTARKERLTADDLASFIYTSGTTATPKGVMLTHRNLVSNHQTIASIIEFDPGESCLSFLPLSHVLERIAYYAFVAIGGTIYYAESIDALSANLLEVKPTILVSVPRVFEKIRAKVFDTMAQAGGVKARIFAWAIAVGKAAIVEREKIGSLSPLLRLQIALANRLVFAKIRERTGGRLRYAICGGAPLSREVAEFFECVGIPLLEGYGMTESSPVITCNVPRKRRLGTVGQPIPEVQVRIAPDGEVLCKGPNVMRGYYRMPEATAEAIDSEGWLHTGDIGRMDADGFLQITDRKKEILVMSNGKNVAPAPIENALITSPYIAQAVVIGDNRNFISALIAPNFEGAERWAREQGLSTDRRVLLANQPFKALIRGEIDRLLADFAKFERVKEFVLLPEELSQENGELTPTLKLKRRVISERHREEIESIYSVSPVPVAN